MNNIEHNLQIINEIKELISALLENEVNVPIIYSNLKEASSSLKGLVTQTELSMKYFTIGNRSIDLFNDIYKINQQYPFACDNIKEMLRVFNEFVKYNQHLQLTELSIEDVEDIIK